jgi:transcription elongation factor
LFNLDLAKQRFPRALRWESRFSLFKGVYYDQDGYAILTALDTDRYIPEDAVLSAEEYNLFSACSSISSEVREKTFKQITSRSFRLEDAVKVVDGDSRGLFGRIIALRDNEADLFLPLDGQTSTIALTSVRKDLRIGDEVRVKSGTHKDITGWVVNKNDESVWLFNHETGIEVRFLPLGFYATDILPRSKFLQVP